MFDLSGHVAVVTGASSGLGKQMAKALAAQGADLAILARRVDRLEELKKEIEGKYGEGTEFAEKRIAEIKGLEKIDAEKYKALKDWKGVHVYPHACDVTSTESIETAAKDIEKEFGKVDILLNVAGASKNAGVLEMTDEEWDFTIEVDQTSVFKMTRTFANIMMKNPETPHGRGRVINIASMYGMVGNTMMGTIAYHSSKGGVVNFTRAAAAELATKGITVNAICPGYFYTELTTETLDTSAFQEYAKNTVPMQRYGKEGELNGAAVFLASDEASYVTGVILPVDGGFTCV